MPEDRLGILGGMGPQATQVFYQRILDMTDAATDQQHIPTLIWSDTAIPDRTAAILGGDAEGCYQRLLSGAKLLERCGCSVLAIPCNTSHYFADRLQNELTIPLLHMVRLTVEGLAQSPQPPKQVAVLATEGTIRAGVYQRECQALGIKAVSPRPEIQALVTSIIYDEIKKGEAGSREKFAAIDRELRSLGCDRAILACTELSVYRSYHDLPAFYLDAMDVLAEAAILRCGHSLRRV